MSTLMEQTSEKETKQLHNNHNDEEIEIDLMDLLRKVIGIRKKIYKAAGICWDNWAIMPLPKMRRVGL